MSSRFENWFVHFVEEHNAPCLDAQQKTSRDEKPVVSDESEEAFSSDVLGGLKVCGSNVLQFRPRNVNLENAVLIA